MEDLLIVMLLLILTHFISTFDMMCYPKSIAVLEIAEATTIGDHQIMGKDMNLHHQVCKH